MYVCVRLCVHVFPCVCICMRARLCAHVFARVSINQKSAALVGAVVVVANAKALGGGRVRDRLRVSVRGIGKARVGISMRVKVKVSEGYRKAEPSLSVSAINTASTNRWDIIDVILKMYQI